MRLVSNELQRKNNEPFPKGFRYRAFPEKRRGHQQREANYKGSEKDEEVSRVLSGFSLTQSPRKIQTFFNNRRLILASV